MTVREGWVVFDCDVRVTIVTTSPVLPGDFSENACGNPLR